MTKAKYILFLVLLMACQPEPSTVKDNCPIDYKFLAHFQNCIQVINIAQLGHSYDFIELSNAYESLRVITKVKTRASSGDTPYVYANPRADLLQDIIDWNNWYNNNKCSITLEKAEKIIAENRKPLPDYTNPLRIESIKIRFGSNLSDKAAIYRDSVDREKTKLRFPNFPYLLNEH